MTTCHLVSLLTFWNNYTTTHNVNNSNPDNGTFNLAFFINDLFEMLKSVVYPQIVKFDKSLLYHNVDNPI